MAEAVFQHLVKSQGLGEFYDVDSAGTGGWHEGESADPRTLATLKQHNISYQGRARQVRPYDFDFSDVILAMDRENQAGLAQIFGTNPDKISLLLDHAPELGVHEVPDPYYGGPDGFERVFELISAACQGLLAELESKRLQAQK